MTSVMSLFSCSAVDVTFSRVRDLVEQAIPESLTLEYKQQYTSSLLTSIAAMANSYGGMILVGVTDAGNDRISGVPESTITQIANACHEGLEPPWQPEIVPVPIPEREDSYLLVVRVDADRAPRPLLQKGAAPIRLHGRNATADRSRLQRLFEQSNSAATTSQMELGVPQIERDNDGRPIADFVVRSGMWIALSPEASWRPISEQAVEALATSLNGSPLSRRLTAWNVFQTDGQHKPFMVHGFNRARRARLAWRSIVAQPNFHPIEAVLTLVLPENFGVEASLMTVTLDVSVRATALRRLTFGRDADQVVLGTDELSDLLDDFIATLTDARVTANLADIAGTGTDLIRQPNVAYFSTGPSVQDLISAPRLSPIPDAGTSHGARLLADPSKDLADGRDRHEQVCSWMIQIALDGGLRGMESITRER